MNRLFTYIDRLLVKEHLQTWKKNATSIHKNICKQNLIK